MHRTRVNEDTSSLAFMREPAQADKHSTPVSYQSHKLTLTELAKNRLEDICTYCHSPVFANNRPVVERNCRHLNHAICQLNRPDTGDVKNICEYCRVKPAKGVGLFTLHKDEQEWREKADKKCEQSGCLYISKRGEYEAQFSCPFPVAMFPDHDKPAFGFVQKYGKLIETMIDKFLSVASLEKGENQYDKISQEEQDSIIRMYGSRHDLNSLLETFSKLKAEILACTEIVDKKLSTSGPFASKSASEMIASAAMVKEEVQKSTLCSAIDHLRMAIVNGGEGEGVLDPEINAMALSTQYEVIPGLSVCPGKDITIVRKFCMPGVDKPLEIRIDSNKFNAEDKTVKEAVGEVVKVIRCALVMGKMAKDYPAYFNDRSEVYLEIPFDYWNNKITIVHKDKRLNIPLNEIIDLAKPSVNYTALLKAVDQHKEMGINRTKLISDKPSQPSLRWTGSALEPIGRPIFGGRPQFGGGGGLQLDGGGLQAGSSLFGSGPIRASGSLFGSLKRSNLGESTDQLDKEPKIIVYEDIL